MELTPRQDEVVRRMAQFLGALSGEGTEPAPAEQSPETPNGTTESTAAA